MLIAPIARLAHTRPNNIATSCRLTVISPMGKWNECVSGRHRPKNAAIKEESYWNRVMCYTAVRKNQSPWLVPLD
jgi:hypothetical protein